MSPVQNKQLMQHAFEHLARGDGRPFADLMAGDFRWIITGKTAWSRVYEGKVAVQEQLLRPLFAQFADRYRNIGQRFIAEFLVIRKRSSSIEAVCPDPEIEIQGTRPSPVAGHAGGRYVLKSIVPGSWSW